MTVILFILPGHSWECFISPLFRKAIQQHAEIMYISGWNQFTTTICEKWKLTRPVEHVNFSAETPGRMVFILRTFIRSLRNMQKNFKIQIEGGKCELDAYSSV